MNGRLLYYADEFTLKWIPTYSVAVVSSFSTHGSFFGAGKPQPTVRSTGGEIRIFVEILIQMKNTPSIALSDNDHSFNRRGSADSHVHRWPIVGLSAHFPAPGQPSLRSYHLNMTISSCRNTIIIADILWPSLGFLCASATETCHRSIAVSVSPPDRHAITSSSSRSFC